MVSKLVKQYNSSPVFGTKRKCGGNVVTLIYCRRRVFTFRENWPFSNEKTEGSKGYVASIIAVRIAWLLTARKPFLPK